MQGFENGSGKSRSREAGLLRGTRFQKREEGKERGKEKTYQLFSVSLVCSIGEGRLLGEPFGAAVTIAQISVHGSVKQGRGDWAA